MHLAAEGITNVYQRPAVKCKIKETLRARYGVSNPNQLPWYASNNGMESKPHKCVFSYIQGLGIPAISEMKGITRALFSKYNDELKRIYSPRPDIMLPTLHVIIEIFGNRWHADLINLHQILKSDCGEVLYRPPLYGVMMQFVSATLNLWICRICHMGISGKRWFV